MVRIATADRRGRMPNRLREGAAREACFGARCMTPSIAELPVHLECRIHRVVDLGEQGVRYGDIHLAIAELACIVLDESVCDEDLRVDQQRLVPVGRMGFQWFTRTTPESMFQPSRVPYADFAATARRPGPMD
jgi:flavin reductase (DIM6/NTAB) family NADH-FMN oxidoreductase RutF